MERRVQLQTLLEEILGSRNVYFQPPESVSLIYPCIIYSRSNGLSKHADDIPYNFQTGYTVIIIDKNPDSVIPAKIAALPMCAFDRHYISNNLNHDVYTIYY